VAVILIATSPVDEPTRYGYTYWKRYARTPAENGHQVVILKNASLSTFEKALNKYDPRLVIMDSHGGSKGVEVNGHVILGVKGYDPELGLKIYGTNTHLMAGRIVYMATCNTGKELAFRLIDAGAIAVLAYREPFIFLSENHTVNPLNDKTAYPFFISLMQPALQLATGKTFGQAVSITRQAFEYYRDLAEQRRDEQAAKYLNFDALNLIALGDMEATL
jgi:hypothetical protein